MFFLRNLKNHLSSKDLRKILSFGALSFIILINYSILRVLKDGFVVKNMGAEAIGLLKFYFLSPVMVILLLIYTNLSNHFSQRKIFFGFCVGFLTLFLILFVIFFKGQILLLSNTEIEIYAKKIPRFKWFVKIILNWHYSLFYILSELWGSIIYTLFFFQLSNSVFTSNEAKIQYPFIIIIGNFSLPAAGGIISFFSGSIKEIFFVIIAINVLTIFCYHFISTGFGSEPLVQKEINKNRQSLTESLRIIFSSKKLWLLFIMLISLGISLNVTEVFWKSKLEKLSDSTTNYIKNMGQIQTYQGWISMLFTLFGAIFLKYFSWKTSSLIVPIFIFITGSTFFSLLIFGISMKTAIFFGIVQTIIGKCIKYSLFDPAKEIIYINLDPDLKTKGKATVDLLGGRLGKSTLGVLESILFFIIPTASFENTIVFFGAIFVIIILAWIKAVITLAKEIK
ncbi:MAG: hypothetical protein ISN64_02085 [Rickettsia sp.]|nr:hypothetical protein [Rickettsia sp.]